jgi:hypothetical protein
MTCQSKTGPETWAPLEMGTLIGWPSISKRTLVVGLLWATTVATTWATANSASAPVI